MNPDEIMYEVRTDIKPSQIILPLDNWRNTPMEAMEEQIESTVAVGLLEMPKVAINKDNNYVAIDGNRRIRACQELEKIEKLPKNWRVGVANHSYETLRNNGILEKLRFHSTTVHKDFDETSRSTKTDSIIQTFASERGLTRRKVLSNNKLRSEITTHLMSELAISKSKALNLIDTAIKKSPLKDEVLEIIHKGDIGKSLGETLNAGIEEGKISEIAEIIKGKKSTKTATETQIKEALTLAKKKAKEEKKDIAEIFQKELAQINPTKILSAEIPLELFNKLNEARIKQSMKWEEYMTTIITNNLEIFLL